jgi:D-serine deaminase-like pyridoxal phosphate-dependent protein
LLIEMTRAGKQVWLMVDNVEQLRILSAAGKGAGVMLHACLEVDMAYRPLNLSSIHLGLRRSPVRTPEQACDLLQAAKTFPGVKVDAIMGYEGHIAGTNDNIPGARLKNLFTRIIKTASVRELTARRDKIVAMLRSAGAENSKVISRGGSGSIVSTGKDPLVTEITVGSGFTQRACSTTIKKSASSLQRFSPSRSYASPPKG